MWGGQQFVDPGICDTPRARNISNLLKLEILIFQLKYDKKACLDLKININI